MLRRIFKWILATLAILVGLTLAVVLILWPPAPLTAERRDIVLRGVTVVNPGVSRHANQRVVIRGSSIESIANDTGEPPGLPLNMSHTSSAAPSTDTQKES